MQQALLMWSLAWQPAAAMTTPSPGRRAAVRSGTALALGVPAWFPGAAAAAPRPGGGGGVTNEVVRTVDGIRQKRLGGSDIIVSELGLGTQRWGSADFNGPDEALCHRMMDRAILESGVNLIDTAEQYPIPSDRARPEGDTERIIGSWLAKDRSRREKVVLSSKITGGRNVQKRSLVADLDGSLQRLGTDYLDCYLLHWPARYSPQSNWGQSLEYRLENDPEAYSRTRASFEEIAEVMGGLVKAGKIRGWGMCNDNAYGLTASCYAAKAQGLAPPCVMQNDYSLINRRIEVTNRLPPSNLRPAACTVLPAPSCTLLHPRPSTLRPQPPNPNLRRTASPRPRAR